jgi:hypothetical protein
MPSTRTNPKPARLALTTPSATFGWLEDVGARWVEGWDP